MTPTPYETALRAEIAALRRVVAALETLDAAAAQRVARYVFARYSEDLQRVADENNAKIEAATRGAA